MNCHGYLDTVNCSMELDGNDGTKYFKIGLLSVFRPSKITRSGPFEGNFAQIIKKVLHGG